jgi:pyruvate/2-oxoglutarate dehydrogenase complex dihydrolipoamide acyltransferase (E2) component
MIAYSKLILRNNKNQFKINFNSFSSFDFSRIVQIKLGDLGEGTKEAEIKKWHLKEGDKVEEEDKVVEVGTDKLIADIPSPVTGMVHKLFYTVGQVCQVGNVLCEVKSDEDIEIPSKPLEEKKSEEKKSSDLEFDKCKYNNDIILLISISHTSSKTYDQKSKS